MPCVRFLLLATLLLSLSRALAQNPDDAAPHLLQISLFFGGGSAYVYPEEGARLREFLDAVPALDNYGVEVQGHTDDIGDRAYNLRLSAARGEAVRRLLIAYPVRETAIEMLPLGEEAPAYDNATWEGKLSNRRVDVILRPLL